ncbi:MAG: hypothetical protein KC468_29330, partial [Myxococcales bacterium]|nr:hypothetical protein [Myxococcales bacterium]
HAPPQLGRILPRLAEALLRQRALTRAEEVLARARAAQDEAGFRDDNEHRMVALKVAAELAVARGRLDAARADYARACGVFASTHDADDPMLADCRLAWARALEPGPSARALAQQARDAYQSLGSGFDEERADAEALLAR